MALFFAAVVSGIALGFLLGLLGFGIVLLYKSTGIANFAQGTLATVGAFFAYKIGLGWGAPLWLAALIGFVLSLALAVIFYLLILRPHDDSGKLNLIIRTLGIQMLTIAVIEKLWSSGQPFGFPSLFASGTAIGFGQAAISWAAIGTVCVAAVLAGSFLLLFRYTDIGLMFLGLSERPEIVRLLGLQTRRLTMLAWVFASGIATIVGVILAPDALLSSDMMEPYMLLAFTAVVLGGLTSLAGVFVGGLIVGVVNNVVSLYANADMAVLVVYALLLCVLSWRPQGIFGSPEIERL